MNHKVDIILTDKLELQSIYPHRSHFIKKVLSNFIQRSFHLMIYQIKQKVSLITKDKNENFLVQEV